MQEIRSARFELTSAHFLALGFLACAGLAAGLIGAFPLQASIVTIFLFAGVHNFFEFRYFIARMPVRWGRSRLYYSVGIGGVVALAAVYLVIYFGSGTWFWNADAWHYAVSGWNTAFVLWVALLFYLRGRQKPRADWSWAFPVAFLVAAFVWLAPAYFSIALVYIHPFIAMWFLERQLRRTKPEWLRSYHFCLLTIPIFVAVLYVIFRNFAELPDDGGLFSRIAQHAGGGILGGVSTHFLVATHVFLETIHYSVWIVLIPLADRRAVPWRLSEIPLCSNQNGFPKLVLTMVSISLFVMVAFWAAFAFDYSTTRDVYFACAIAHVLAEFPFLVKML